MLCPISRLATRSGKSRFAGQYPPEQKKCLPGSNSSHIGLILWWIGLLRCPECILLKKPGFFGLFFISPTRSEFTQSICIWVYI